MWMIIRTIQWGLTLLAATVGVRIATALVAAWRPPPPNGERRRDGRWLLGWLIMLAVSLALVHCQAGAYYTFIDPAGGDWDFDAHGWPLVEPHSVFESVSQNSAMEAIYWLAIAIDLGCSLALLAATRIVIDHWLAAWDTPDRWRALRREAAGWLAALAAVLVCERLAARPPRLPGTEIIVYSTLFYESPEVRAAMLIGLSSATYLVGLSVLSGARTLKRLREEGVV